ncbi:aquaporin-like protein [Clohesyomyces aquaticus]|uniref:Aquaporin-like protein n=1 Tax=Clohesyomyces aquaticus TaxID=1231657 RepID=A0A1Y1ZFD1_9PLEO|nr:aquaporin-like protein [Clohesyomyces aquaticus]
MPRPSASEPPKTHDWVDCESPERHHHEHLPNSHTLQNAPTESSAGINGMDSYKTSSSLQKTRSALGLHPKAPIDEDHDIHPRQQLLWSRIRIVLREPFAEFWGTVIMIMFGDGSVAQVLLSTGQTTAPGGNGFGSYQSISWGWGLGVMLGIYVAGDSGAYLNPAITFSNCLFRQLPWRRFPVYFIAQLVGGFVGSGVVYANYINAINNVEGHGLRTVPPSPKATAGIFCTYPQPFMTKAGQFFSEFIASALLINNGVPRSDKWFPLCLFFLIFGLGACFGWETGYAINLARDFGPRLMSYAVGYGPEVWSAGGYYFWVSSTRIDCRTVPMVAPFCGCAFGGFLYDLFIFTGQSPVNTPWLGLKHLWPPYAWQVRREHAKRNKEDGIV